MIESFGLWSRCIQGPSRFWKLHHFLYDKPLWLLGLSLFFWRVKIDKRNWIRGLCKKYAKISAGLPRFNVNINCEVNMNRAQTPTRKTVLVFQFFMFTSQLIFTLKRGSPADIFAYIIERKTYIFHEISFHQVFWRIPYSLMFYDLFYQEIKFNRRHT